MDDATRKRIGDIIRLMQGLRNSGTAEREQLPLMAELMSLIAEDQAQSAAKLERFTCWLIVLTVALVFIGLIQIAMMIHGH